MIKDSASGSAIDSIQNKNLVLPEDDESASNANSRLQVQQVEDDDDDGEFAADDDGDNHSEYSKDVCESLHKNDDILTAIHTRREAFRNVTGYKSRVRRLRKKNHTMAFGVTESIVLEQNGAQDNSDLNCVLQKAKKAAAEGDKDVNPSFRLNIHGTG